MNQTLPSEEAIAKARAMGFTTIVVRHDAGDPWASRRRRKFILFTRRDQGRHLERLYGNDSLTAYGIRDPGGAGDG